MPEASPLAGIRVIDFADATAALLARRLADLGADVIKVEPPGGDPARRRGPFLGDVPGPERSLWFRYHQQNKSGVILDIETSEGRDMVLKLAAGADVLVETFRPGYLDKLGLGYDALQKINPGLVYAAVTGFGQNGPRRDYRSGDLVAAASGGAMSVCGLPQRPLKPYGEQASQLAALDAAIGVMLALRARAVTGLGQYLDVSLQEAVCTALDHVLPRYLYQSPGVVPGRHGSHHWNGTFAVSPCRDGDMLISPNLEPETLLELMVADGVRGDLDAAALTKISKYTVKHDASELFALGRAMRLPWAVVATPEMVTRSPQLEARGFWVKLSDDELGPIVYPGPPAHFSSIKLASRRAPYLGEHNRRLADPAKIWPPRKPIRTGGSISGGILAGVRVLDFTRVLAGPYATRLLGDFGAEVIKVQTRHVMPGVENEQGYFRTWNRNKRSITLNMGRPEGRALAMRLLHKCDVVLENFTPRVLENWGMTYPELKKVKPDIILVSLSGAGHDGPWRDAAAYGATI